VKSSAPRRSCLSVLNNNGFPCEREEDGPCHIDPVIDLTEIGQFADAASDQLLTLVLWFAPSIRPCRNVHAEMVDRGQLAWAPVRLETENVEFDTGCLGVWGVIHKDSQTRIE
jgi:hypothetical protein